jgi:hypothetical protein
MQITIEMDQDDFDHLTVSSTNWASTKDTWLKQITEDGRFEMYGKGRTYDEMPGLHWKRAYWLEDGYTSVVLAKAFLAGEQYNYELVWDLAEDGSWVILTDFGGELGG